MKLTHTLIAAAVTAAFTASPAFAKLTDAEVARLGKDLTPLGGEMAGNKDGSIPAYTGGLTKPPACFKPGVDYCDPYSDEKPLFVITAANAEQYKDKLAPGAIALLKKYPTFKMPVYATHRTAAVPAAVADNVKKEATKIELNGFGLANRDQSTTPFPIPKNGLEAIWNHNIRYLGGSLRRAGRLPGAPERRLLQGDHGREPRGQHRDGQAARQQDVLLHLVLHFAPDTGRHRVPGA